MKQSPEMAKLEAMLRSSQLVAGGFLGDDSRNLSEIIEADRFELEKSGVTASEVARQMRKITDVAKKELGRRVMVSENLQAWVEEAKGVLVCPWPHSGGFAKRTTTLRDVESGESVTWSDLNIHLIKEHSFFEGKGSALRLCPGKLIKLTCRSV